MDEIMRTHEDTRGVLSEEEILAAEDACRTLMGELSEHRGRLVATRSETARRLLRAKLDRRGHLNMPEAISVGMVFHLVRNERNTIFVPVGDGYRAVFYIVKRFARLMIDKRSPEFDQITVFIHRARKRESAVGDNIV